MITTLGKALSNWDQFSYWSYAAKDMFYTNSLVINSQIGMYYPPFPMILEYFFMNIVGQYSQGLESFTIIIFGFSILIPIFEKIKQDNKRRISKFATGVILLAIPAVFTSLIFYESSYPDAILGLMIGYIVYNFVYEKNRKFKILSLLLSTLILTLTKPVGFYIAGIMLFILLIYEFIIYRINNKNNKVQIKHIIKTTEIKNIVIIGIIAIILFLSWYVYLNILNKAKRDIGEAKYENYIEYILKSIGTTVLGTYEENNDAANSNGNLINSLSKGTGISEPFKISILGTNFIFILICVYLYKYKLKNKEKTKFGITTIVINIGFILYILFLQITYLLMFNTTEMINHNGIERYIQTYLLGFLYFIISSIYTNLDESKNYKNLNYVIILIAILSITSIKSIANVTITSGIYNINENQICNNGRFISNEFEKIEGYNKQQKILIIAQTSMQKLYGLMARYYMYPMNVETYQIDENNENSYYELNELLNKEYDYIYIIDTDKFIENNLIKLNGNNILRDDIFKYENMELIKANN